MYLIFVILLTLIMLAISYLQFNERGPVINNTYLWVNLVGQENIDKSLLYKQSATLFLLLGLFVLSIGISLIYELQIFAIIAVFIIILIALFTLISSIYIFQKHYRNK